MTRAVLSALGIDGSPPRVLEVSAYVVTVAWGIRAASEILSVVLLSLFFAFVYLPLPKWLIRRFHLRKAVAISLSVALLALLYLIFSVGLFEAGFKMRERLPIYEEHFASLYHQLVVFLSAHGIESSALSSTNFYSSERIVTFISFFLPKVVGLFSDRVLVGILSLIFLSEIAESEGIATTPLGRRLLYYGKDVQRFIVISAGTGAIIALANLVLLIALGIDFPVLCCVLYFVLQFIPSIGFLIAIVPPALLALLTFGWKKGPVCDHRTRHDANGFGLHSSTYGDEEEYAHQSSGDYARAHDLGVPIGTSGHDSGRASNDCSQKVHTTATHRERPRCSRTCTDKHLHMINRLYRRAHGRRGIIRAHHACATSLPALQLNSHC